MSTIIALFTIFNNLIGPILVWFRVVFLLIEAKVVQSRIDALIDLPDKIDTFRESPDLRESENIIGEVKIVDCTAKWLDESIQDKLLVFSTEE